MLLALLVHLVVSGYSCDREEAVALEPFDGGLGNFDKTSTPIPKTEHSSTIYAVHPEQSYNKHLNHESKRSFE